MRRSKYNATKTVVDGITFASKAEARRYAELKLLEKSGHIWDLRTQPEYPLDSPTPRGFVRLGKYIGDFAYFDNKENAVLVEDVKGFKTPLYRWKKKHVEAQYGIKIVEIK